MVCKESHRLGNFHIDVISLILVVSFDFISYVMF